MGYLFLAISLFAGATKGYCGKMTSGYVKGYKDAVLANMIRMVLCVLIGLILIGANRNWGYLLPSPLIMAICALSGITTSVFVVCWLISVRKGAYMMLDVFLMLGVLVPLLGGRMLFQESIKGTQWIGIGILFIAAYIMCSYNNSIKSKLNIHSLALLFVCGLSNGLTDFSQKMFVKIADGVPVAIFNFYTYIFSALTLLVFYLTTNKKTDDANSETSSIRKIFGYILVMSVCLFANSYFKTMAAEYLDSVQLYPVSTGAALIVATMMSAFLFREKITFKCFVGVVMAFIGLIVLNCL